MERSNKAKREFEAELAKRLALGFESESWGEGSTLSFDEVGGWLQISSAEAGLLSTVGLLKSFDRRIKLKELLRFLETHPKWLLWRAERAERKWTCGPVEGLTERARIADQ
jgi:hypothetical protein